MRGYNSVSHGRIYSISSALNLEMPAISFSTENSLIRTTWKPNTFSMEIKSYLVEIINFLIRTSRKRKLDLSRIFAIKPYHYVVLQNIIFRISELNPIRTARKSNLFSMEIKSYQTEKNTSLMRTPRNFIRTTWKRTLDIVQEKSVFKASINTFIYINKGMN